MSYELPTRIQVARLEIIRSHNRRLMLWIGSLVVGFIILNKIPQIPLLGVFCILEAAGLIYVLRRVRKQCIDLGFVCPTCGGALYENSRYSSHLVHDGECPQCGDFIIDRLK